MATLFISDLHLDSTRPELSRFFFDFLAHRARGADALYILGDFFEVWVGDDERLPLHDAVAAALMGLSREGTGIFLMTGNRDFLLGPDFAERCGASLLAEPHLIVLDGQRTLLMHGDALCTGDTEYQKFRAMTRDPTWQSKVLDRPLADRQTMARQLRQVSMARNRGREESIMDVTPDEVARVMNLHDATRLIHGHTHRPAAHDVTLAQGTGQRLVLGDWHANSMVYAIADGDGARLLTQRAEDLEMPAS